MRFLMPLLLTLALSATISCTQKTVVKDTSPAMMPGSTNFNDPVALAFVDDLMGKMTLEEIIGQTVMYSGGWDVTGPTISKNNEEFIRQGNVGAMLNVYSAKGTRNLQEIAVNETRLGIPLLFGYDVIHGHRTIFPINLGSAASFDMEQIELSARIAAEEASAEGIHWTFAPMVDIARDPRWGRISEGAGEDGYLGIQVAKAYVKGFQGDDISKNNTILACAKHFVGYGAAQAGRDYHTVDMSERELWETYLPPFKATVDAGVWTFMTAFNDLNGVPASGNSYIFRDILRDKWNFDGFVVSDYTAINELIPHGYAEDGKDAARLAMNAGIDMDMMGSLNKNHLEALIEEGKVSKAIVEDACKRILLSKYALGLFEDPFRYIDEGREKETIYRPQYLAAARKLAASSSVLLKNEDKALPLNSSSKIALIGPLAKDTESIIGNWAAAGDRTGIAKSVYQGLLEYSPEDQIIYAQGTGLSANATSIEEVSDESMFPDAIAAAKAADVIVMVVGEHYHMSGEAASRTNIQLPGNQTRLIEMVRTAAPQKPLILVLMNGRPLDLSREDQLADAILETWFPGTMGGPGIADVLFGAYNPSAKLPVTFPRNIGQVPIYYDMKNTGRPMNPENPKGDYRSFYQDSPNDPLYPFGHGLSYTTFEYSTPQVASSIRMNEPIKISVSVKNTGDRDGAEVVQLYLHDNFASVTRPVRELKGFEKVMIKSGETKTVSFELSPDALKFYDQKMNFVSEPGNFDVYVGGSSTTTNKSSFKLVP